MLCGCSRGREVHEQLVIQGIAIDKENDGYILTAQAYDFQSPKDEKEPSVRVIEVSGETLLEALQNITQKTSLTPIYSQNTVILMGESVAKSGVNDFIDFFIRHCEARPKVKICACKGSASHALKIKQGEKAFKAQNINDLIPDELCSDVMHFVGDVRGGISDPYVALIDVSEDTGAMLIGVSVFHEDEIACSLVGEDLFGFMLIKGVPHFGSCIVSDEFFGEVTCTPEKASAKIWSELRENMYPIFKINLNINMAAFSFDHKSKGERTEDDVQRLRAKLECEVQNILQKTLAKIISAGSDALGFGKILRNMHLEYFKKLDGNWKNIMSKCDYEITQKSNLKITGKEIV